MGHNLVLRLLDWARTTQWVLWVVGAFTVAVTSWGFYAYYGPQFAWIARATGGREPWVYPFVPDCPLFGLLFVVVLVLQRVRIYNNTLAAFIAIGNVKFGIWTVFVLLYYFDRFFGPQSSEALLRGTILALHIGMVPLGLILWRGLRPLRAYQYALIGGASLLYDYFDYWYTDRYQVYPIGLPDNGYGIPLPPAGLGIVPVFTILESVVLVGLLALSFRSSRPAGDGGKTTATTDP